jgi:hypothetical protein
MMTCERHKTVYSLVCRECLHEHHKTEEALKKAQSKRDKLKEKAKLKQQEPKPAINKVSVKQKEKNTEYGIRVKEWKKENPKCKANCNQYCTKETDDCQHLRGRGKYLMDESTWMPVCRSCHTYIGDHSKEAYEKGWALSRLETVTQEPHKI